MKTIKELELKIPKKIKIKTQISIMNQKMIITLIMKIMTKTTKNYKI